jgi:predicted Zn-dependent protease
MRPVRVWAVLALAILGAGCNTIRVGFGPIDDLAQVASATKGPFTDLDEPEEIELGRAVTAALATRYPLLLDRELTRYVALVGNAVAAHSDRPDIRYRFGVLATGEVNAFAAPGGYVLVTRGALALMRDEAMLAGVLGHEIAHVAVRHHLETIKASKRKELAMAGVRTGLAFVPGPAGAFAGAISLAADALAEQVILKGFSRAEEGEADAVGLRYAARAGYDPAGLRDFLTAMVARGEGDAEAGRFFSTHPGTADRLREQTRHLQGQPGGGARNADRFVRAMAGGARD